MSIVVIILTLDQRQRTLQCLDSLLVIQDPDFDVILWDNGSQDSTAEDVQASYPGVKVHYNDTNLGVASGRNAAAALAIEFFGPSHLLFLDNDMLVEPGFVQGLLQPFLEDAAVGQTQAKLRFMDDRQRLNDGGGAQINFISWQVTPVGYGEIDRGQHDAVKPCISCGGAMMVRADVFQELNGFDTTFDPFGPEDIDFSLRLQEAGYKALYAPRAVAYHVVSHTYGQGYSENYARHKTRHWFAFMRRHATPWQKLGFYVIGAPYLFVRIVLREGKKGNLQALRGLLRGAYDTIRSS